MLEESKDIANKTVSIWRPNKEFFFFTPSTTKLIVMSICTLGLYELYWFYKNWVILKSVGTNCIPILRVIFAPLFAYSCFWYINQSKINKKIDLKFPIISLAVFYFILCVSANFPDPYSLISYFTFVPVAIANRIALAVNNAQLPGFASNSKFSKWNWLAIIIGGPLSIFLVWVSILPGA